MIVTGSRYMGQPVVPVTTSDGDKTQAVYRSGSPNLLVTNFSYYTVLEGDRLDIIAAKIYGVPSYWWRIADANPELWYPQELVVGAIIRIPQ
jgi:nucleoid-associated protein YgaU